MPAPGDELHHFGWNACSSALCPSAPRPHVERRYLIVPGLRSSKTYVVDTKNDPRTPKIVKTIEAGELSHRTGYSRPHTTHCGPDAIYVSALGGANGPEEAGDIYLLDCESFDPLGAWEVDKGDQRFAYEFWWHIGWDTLVSSEWASPAMFENGVCPRAPASRLGERRPRVGGGLACRRGGDAVPRVGALTAKTAAPMRLGFPHSRHPA